MSRLAYVYEKIDTEDNGHLRLVNVKYSGGVYEGSEWVETFWKEVLAYLESTYNMEKVQRINLNGGGAAWVKIDTNVLPKVEFVLDKFHMHKYIITANFHLGDRAEDARSEIYRAIYKTWKKSLRRSVWPDHKSHRQWNKKKNSRNLKGRHYE